MKLVMFVNGSRLFRLIYDYYDKKLSTYYKLYTVTASTRGTVPLEREGKPQALRKRRNFHSSQNHNDN